MTRSLRFRLPALFLLGIVLAAVVATLIAISFFQSYTRTHATSELRGESAGIVDLYTQKAAIGHVSVKNLELALSRDKVFWVPAVPGGLLLAGALPELPSSVLPSPALRDGKPSAFDLHVDGTASSRQAISVSRRSGGAAARTASVSREGSPAKYRRV